VEYQAGGVGSYNEVERSDREEENKESLNDLSLTVKEYSSSRVSSVPRIFENGSEKKKFAEWKYDLRKIKQDMEKRKLSYQEVNEFVQSIEDEEVPKKQKQKQKQDKIHRIIENHLPKQQDKHIPSGSVDPRPRTKKAIKIFDPVPVAKRLSKDQYEHSLKEFLWRENKTSAGIRTTCEWDGQRTMHDILERRKTSDYHQYLKINTNRYPVRGLHEDVINDISGSATSRLKHCCGSNDNCNIF